MPSDSCECGVPGIEPEPMRGLPCNEPPGDLLADSFVPESLSRILCPKLAWPDLVWDDLQKIDKCIIFTICSSILYHQLI